MEYLNALPARMRLGEYEIENVLGAGGFGITYRAYDANLKKVVALKEYLPSEIATRTNTWTVVPVSPVHQADYAWGLERFLDEACTLARFDHPHLNRVHRYFEAHSTAYLVLEYVEGEPLSAVLRQHQTLRQGTMKRLLAGVLSGLEAVHAAGYVHRDLKPDNLMVQPNGSVVVLDFGAARQAVGQRSKSITAILTPGYAPIEQYDTKAKDVGPWSDLYALGMVAYRCISGLGDGDLPDAVTRSRAARRGSGDLEPAASIGRGRYDARLLRAIDWAIQVEETDRPQSISAWRTVLLPLDSREQSLPPSLSQPSASEPKRPKPAAEGSTSKLPFGATKRGIVPLIIRAVRGGSYRLGQSMQREQARLERAIAQLNVQMVQIEGGTFTMGCTPEQEDCDDNKKPAHQVRVHSFELSKYEVTQKLWEAVMGKNLSYFKNCPRCPVENVSWNDVQAFLQKLNAGGGRYRLPSEAEWEYAARGAGRSRGYEYAGSNDPDAVAWYGGNSSSKTHPVGQKQANELGLYDMSGNVWEWVQDCRNESSAGALSKGLRGGSWNSEPWLLCVAYHERYPAVIRSSLGFRIARSLS